MSAQYFDVKVAANGRMVLPAKVRKALGMVGDAKITLVVENEEVTFQSLGKRVLRAQELARKYAGPGSSVDEFLAQRNAEWAEEAGEQA